jgi:hypothetical protein
MCFASLHRILFLLSSLGRSVNPSTFGFRETAAN